MPCEQCGLPTAMLIFAPSAETSDQLADYARLIYKKVKGINVPTWIVGDTREVVVNGELAGRA